MLLMAEKGIRSEVCHAIHRYAKANKKYMKDYDKNKNHPMLSIGAWIILYGWGMSQTLHLSGFKWIKETLIRFNKKL